MLTMLSAFALRTRLLKPTLAGAAIRLTELVREGSPPPGLRLLQTKLSRNSNQIARRRIRWFESYMPSHAVWSPSLHVKRRLTQNGTVPKCIERIIDQEL
jgi:hypothetical protein